MGITNLFRSMEAYIFEEDKSGRDKFFSINLQGEK